MTGEPDRNVYGVGIGPLSKILAVKIPPDQNGSTRLFFLVAQGHCGVYLHALLCNMYMIKVDIIVKNCLDTSTSPGP